MNWRETFAAALASTLLAGPGCAGAPEAPANYDASTPGDYRTLGRVDAPVTVFEFTDLQCPYCARFALHTFPELRHRYIDTGKVRFASRDLPLPFHVHAMPAAVAARCAGEQGKFWAFRDMLFRDQSQLAAAPYTAIAARLGLDAQKFGACLADPRVQDEVRADTALAQSNGITGTPTLVIGRMANGQFHGETVVGAQPIEAYAAKIDALLKQ